MLKPSLFFFLFISYIYVQAQSCCSGGAPLSSSLGLPTAEQNTFQIYLGYDVNLLNTLKDGTDKLDDDSRRRTTHTAIIQLGYTFTKKISFDFLIPYVRQEREITPMDRPSSLDYSQGMGDVVLLGKFLLIPNYQIGLGLKFPTGSTSEKNSHGITLNADMQPGSGSWDMIYWFIGGQTLNARPSANLSLLATFRATGENPEYFGSQIYDFGNETQSILTYADQVLLGSLILNPSMGLKFRHVNEDKNDGIIVPGTGGTWLFVRPGLAVPMGTHTEIQSTLELPLFAHVVGTQVTPTVRFNIAVLFSLTPNKTVKV